MGVEHDSGYKYLFTAPEMVRDLIIGFVPDAWLHGLDYSTLELISGHYITDDFRSRSDDVVWRVKVGESWFYLYLVIEFQSTVDKYMALRMMIYQGLLYQDLVKRGAVLPDGRLPPILPIVLYNGKPRWSAVTDLSALIPAVPGLVSQFIPANRYLLLAQNSYTDNELASLKNLVATIFRIEHPATPDTIKQLLNHLNEWLSDRPDLKRMMAIWIRATLKHKEQYRILLPAVNDLQEINMALSDRLEEWANEYRAEGMQQGIQKGRQEGMQQGKQEGMQQGEALALQKLLTKRFGAIPSNVLNEISQASREQIETWFDRAIEATNYNEVFGTLTH